MGIEPTTSSLARTRSTAELRPLDEVSSREWPRWCAEGQNRTDDTSIFSAVLYQLSYLGPTIMLVPRDLGVKLPKFPAAGLSSKLLRRCEPGPFSPCCLKCY